MNWELKIFNKRKEKHTFHWRGHFYSGKMLIECIILFNFVPSLLLFFFQIRQQQDANLLKREMMQNAKKLFFIIY